MALLNIMRVRHGVTVDELAAGLSLTRTTIINHLHSLMGEGLVRRGGLRRGQRRPSVVYELTAEADRAFPQLYEEFSEDLLDELGSEQPARVKRIFAGIGKRWIARDAPAVKNLRGPRRIEAALSLLTERGFMPAWEGTASKRTLYQYNCPLRSLCQRDPEVTNLIHRWIQSLFGVGLARTGCMAKGDRSCVYVVKR
ncbi:MAG TPA: helix-turn-helix domain-containing protein [Candidatus Binatus sp.]|nr:helix-turn-helix domain-containing protein [Candidatus Binatus sp.]